MIKPLCTVAIVGCGLGGLAAAIGIRKAGHEVVMFEQASELKEVGAGIQVPPNSTRIFKRWNILPAIESHAVRPNSYVYRAYRDGSVLTDQKLGRHAESIYGAPYFVIHRADLLNALYVEAKQLGVKFRLGSTVIKFDFDKPAIELLGGDVFEADVVFGGDGLKSVCREALLGHPDQLPASGTMAYRLTVKISELEKHPDLIRFVDEGNVNVWIGPGCQAVCYPLKEGGLYNMVLACPDSLPPDVEIAEAKMEDINAEMELWDPQLKKLFNMGQPVGKWRLRHSHEMASWSHPNGTVALLGDAAHATLPYLNQGAAQAAEDGGVLGDLFEKLERKDQIPDLLRIYEKIRKPRTTRVVSGSDYQREVSHWPDGEAQRERDRQMTSTAPDRKYPIINADPDFEKWLFSYDTKAEVDAAWKQYWQ